jgi:hypothetical protein
VLNLILLFPIALLASLTAPPLDAQTPRTFARMVCLKANPGKSGELEKLLLDTAVKVTQYNINQGKIARYSVSRAAYPVGADAQCDIIGTYFYDAFPPDTTKDSTTEAWVASGVGLTYAEFQVKLAVAGRTIRLDLLELRESVGSAGLGDYFTIDYLKVKDDRAWLDWQTKISKPIHELREKQKQIKGWEAWRTMLPRGSRQPFSAIGVTSYPSWKAVGELKPLSEFAKIALPGMNWEEVVDKSHRYSEMVNREMYKNVVLLTRQPEGKK